MPDQAPLPDTPGPLAGQDTPPPPSRPRVRTVAVPFSDRVAKVQASDRTVKVPRRPGD